MSEREDLRRDVAARTARAAVLVAVGTAQAAGWDDLAEALLPIVQEATERLALVSVGSYQAQRRGQRRA